MEAIGIIVTLVGVFFLIMLAYRNYQSSIDPNARRKRLARTIEDAQDELARLDKE